MVNIVNINGRRLADFFFNDLPEPDRYLFHYTTADGLAAIIDSRRFRFSSLSGMNDPRENRNWVYTINWQPGDSDFPGHNYPEFQAAFDALLRDPVRLLSATVEDDGVPTDALFLRGCSRARNWAQYGDDHRGACLVLDREAFEGSVRDAVSARTPTATVHSARVHYEDRQATMLTNEQFIEIRKPLADDPAKWREVAVEWHRKYWRELFFRKNLDWASEKEHRVVVIGIPDQDVFEVDLTTSLAAVVLGDAFPTTQESVLEHRLNRSGFSHAVVGRMAYYNGAPDAREAGYGLKHRYMNDVSVRAEFGVETLRSGG